MMVYYYVVNDYIKIVVNSNHVQNLFGDDINSNGGVPKRVFRFVVGSGRRSTTVDDLPIAATVDVITLW